MNLNGLAPGLDGEGPGGGHFEGSRTNIGACVLHWASCRPLPCCAGTGEGRQRQMECHCHHLPAPLHKPFDLVIAADWCVFCPPLLVPWWQLAFQA